MTSIKSKEKLAYSYSIHPNYVVRVVVGLNQWTRDTSNIICTKHGVQTMFGLESTNCDREISRQTPWDGIWLAVEMC